MKKNLIGILTISLCICFIVIMALIYSTQKPPQPDAYAVNHLFIFSAANYHPEPQKHMQYVIDTLSIPFLCALAYFSLSHLFTKLMLNKFGKIYWLLSLEVIVVAIIYLFLLVYSARLGYQYLESTLLAQKPVVALILCAFLLLGWLLFRMQQERTSNIRKFLLSPLAVSIGAILILLVSIATVLNEADPYIPGDSFVAYFDSVVQVFLGKTLLVDISPQYGLYALILKPLFSVIGLSVLKFTLLMALLKAIAFFCIFLLLFKATHSKLIAFMGFTTILFFDAILAVVDINSDPYFQYSPHRLFFPAVFTLLLWFYIVGKNPVHRKYLFLFLSFFCSLAVLWNTDTGIIVLITWIIYVIFEEMLSYRFQKLWTFIVKCLKRLAIILSFTFLVAMVFILYTYFSSGQLPSLAKLTLSTRLFYFYGFYMMPMRPIHPWNLVVLIFIIGLFLSISYLLDSNKYTFAHVTRDPKEQAFYKLNFALSVLGIGLFNYFVGRSHDWNLLPVSWVPLILVTLLTDRLFFQLARMLSNRSLKWRTKALLLFRHNDKVFYSLILFFFLGISSLSVFSNLSSYQKLPQSRLSAVAAGMPAFLSQQIQFIKSTSQKNDPVFVLSDYAPELYLYSQHARPLPVSGFGEIVLQEEVRQIDTFLSNPPENAKIYWNPAFTFIEPRSFRNLTSVGLSEDGGLILFESKGR